MYLLSRQYLAGEHLEKVLHGSVEKCLPLMAKQTGAFNPETIINLMVYNILNAVCFGKRYEKLTYSNSSISVQNGYSSLSIQSMYRSVRGHIR